MLISITWLNKRLVDVRRPVKFKYINFSSKEKEKNEYLEHVNYSMICFIWLYIASCLVRESFTHTSRHHYRWKVANPFSTEKSLSCHIQCDIGPWLLILVLFQRTAPFSGFLRQAGTFSNSDPYEIYTFACQVHIVILHRFLDKTYKKNPKWIVFGNFIYFIANK